MSINIHVISAEVNDSLGTVGRTVIEAGYSVPILDRIAVRRTEKERTRTNKTYTITYSENVKISFIYTS